MLPKLRQPSRAATDTLRGFRYQLLGAVRTWLQLSDEEVLVCEGNEDVDRHLLDKDGRILEATEEQLKAVASLPTGVEALKTVLAFAMAFEEHRRAGRGCRMVFTSTASTANDGGASPSRGVRGIVADWSALPETASPKRSGALNDLTDRLRSSLLKKATDLDGSDAGKTANIVAYLDDTRAWEAFLDAVAWEFGADGVEQLRGLILANLRARTDVTLPPALVLPCLLHRVLIASSEAEVGSRVLTSIDLRAELGRGEAELRERVRDRNLTYLEDLLSPLQTTETFFAPFSTSESVFNHALPLVGRKDAVDAVVAFANSSEEVVRILVAPSGAGKSRVLYAAARLLDGHASSPVVRFLDSRWGGAATNPMLDLPDTDLILVLDDATPGADLDVLLACRGRTGATTKLLLTTWPNRLDAIKAHLIRRGVPHELVDVQEFTPLKRQEAIDLAESALGSEHSHLAEPLGVRHRDCPFAIVVGGTLISREQIVPEALQTNEAFLEVVVGRLRTAAAEACQKLNADLGLPHGNRALEVLALLGPLRAAPDEAHSRMSRFLALPPDTLTRLLDGLQRAGFVLRRGNLRAVSPDLLADSLAMDACMGMDGSTGLADHLYAEFKEEAGDRILQRAAEMSARSASMHATPFARIWERIVREYSESDQTGRQRVLQRLEGAGYWQPQRVLSFTREILAGLVSAPSEASPKRPRNPWSSDRGDLRSAVARVLRGVSYRVDFLRPCLVQLAELHFEGAAEDVVNHVASYHRGKPVSYHTAVLEFVDERMGQVGEPGQARLMDFVEPMVRRIGEYQYTEGHSWTHGHFGISCANTRDVRARCRAIVARGLASESPSVAARAAVVVERALKPELPEQIGAATEEPDCWAAEEKAWIDLAESQSRTATPSLELLLLQAVDWQARHGASPAGDLARELSSRLKTAPRIRRLAAIAGKYEVILPRPLDHDEWVADLEEFYRSEADGLLSDCPTAQQIVAALLAAQQTLSAAGLPYHPEQVLSRISEANLGLALDIAREALARKAAPLYRELGLLLSYDTSESASALRELAERIFDESDRTALLSLAGSFVCLRTWRAHADLVPEVARRLLDSGDDDVVARTIDSLKFPSREFPVQATDLALGVGVADAPDLIEEVAELFGGKHGLPLDTLSDPQLRLLRLRLLEAPRLDRYWTERMLTAWQERDPKDLVDLLAERVATKDSRARGYQPIPYKSRDFRLSVPHDQVEPAATRVWDEARGQPELASRWADLFWRIAADSGRALPLLHERLATANIDDLRTIGSIFRGAPNGLILSHPQFVADAFERGQQLDADAREIASWLSWSALPREIRGGKPGEAPGAWLTAKKQAERARDQLEQLSSAWSFFDDLANRVAEDIERWLIRDAEFGV